MSVGAVMMQPAMAQGLTYQSASLPQVACAAPTTYATVPQQLIYEQPQQALTYAASTQQVYQQQPQVMQSPPVVQYAAAPTEEVTYAAPMVYEQQPTMVYQSPSQQVVYEQPQTYQLPSQQVVYEQPPLYQAASQQVVYEQPQAITYAAPSQSVVFEQAPMVTYASMEQPQAVSLVSAAPTAVYEQPGALTYTGGVGQPVVYEAPAQPVSFVAAAQPVFEQQQTMTYAVPAQPAYELQPAMTYATAYGTPTMIEAQPQAYFSAFEQPQQAALTTTGLPPLGSQQAGCDWQQQQAVMSAPSMVVPAPGFGFMQNSQQQVSAPGVEVSGSASMAPPPHYDSQPVTTATNMSSKMAKSSKMARKGKKLSQKKTRRDCC